MKTRHDCFDRRSGLKQLTLGMGEGAVKEALATIFQEVQHAGGRALFVGGCVRDALLGLAAKDLDIEVYGVSPESLRALLETHFKVEVVGEAFGVMKLHGLPVDISLPRRESKAGRGHKAFDIFSDPSMTPEQAAVRRDFTINAIAYDPVTGDLIDPFLGVQDLEARTLRHVGGQFSEDPLRVLRGLQLAGRFSLDVHPDTIRLSRQLVDEYETLPIERIWAEWYKWAGQSKEPSRGLRFLEHCGWRERYPELDALTGCPQDPRFHPEGNVWEHTLLVADQSARIAERDQLSLEDRAVLVFAGVCHDLGKPETTEILPDRIRSRGHSGKTETYERFLRRIGMPRALADRVIALCHYHLTHIDFQGSTRHVRRVAVALGEAGESLDMLARLVEADHSGRPPLPQEMPQNMRAMLTVAQGLSIQNQAPKPLLMGRHLLAMKVPPGPMMGKLLRAAFDAQLEGEFETLDGAREWIQQYDEWSSEGCSM
ncbi:MAG: HD domain-containing protein [Nitrospirales bacterium]|nr:HD domain-containing protein [Nitrospira sp.]MDR4502411.1 HD domain-containing protein [Nitrospirales bacterium]